MTSVPLKEIQISEDKWGKVLKLTIPLERKLEIINTSFFTVNHSLLGNISRKYHVLSELESTKIIIVLITI